MFVLWAALSHASPPDEAEPPGQQGVWLAAAGWYQPPTRAQTALWVVDELAPFEVGRAAAGLRLRPNEVLGVRLDAATVARRWQGRFPLPYVIDPPKIGGVVRWEASAVAEFTPVVGYLVAGGARIPLAVHALVGSAVVGTEDLGWIDPDEGKQVHPALDLGAAASALSGRWSVEVGMNHLVWIEPVDGTTLTVERRWRPTLGIAVAPFGARGSS